MQVLIGIKEFQILQRLVTAEGILFILSKEIYPKKTCFFCVFKARKSKKRA